MIAFVSQLNKLNSIRCINETHSSFIVDFIHGWLWVSQTWYGETAKWYAESFTKIAWQLSQL